MHNLAKVHLSCIKLQKIKGAHSNKNHNAPSHNNQKRSLLRTRHRRLCLAIPNCRPTVHQKFMCRTSFSPPAKLPKPQRRDPPIQKHKNSTSYASNIHTYSIGPIKIHTYIFYATHGHQKIWS